MPLADVDHDARRGLQVWLRRCRRCGVDDLRAAFGQPAMIDDRPWHCPACGGAEWRAACVDLPVEPGLRGCPLRQGST
jgi:hypothetical protein